MFGHNSFTHPFEAPNGWMQPTNTKTFHSLWVGDQQQTKKGGKNKFRKTPSPPPNVSRQKIQHQTKGTIYEYHADRPKYHQYITGSNYKTDFQSRERLASKYTQITDLNEELGGIEQELDGVYAKKEELEGKLVSLTQKLDNLNDSYVRELASYTTTYGKDNDFKRRKSQDIANGAKKWKQAQARKNARRRPSRRAETEIPMVSVKIDTTATNISPDWEVSHRLPSDTKWYHYGSSWTQYQTMPYVENNKGTHCFTVVESNDSAVPVGTTYGNCADDSDNGDENGDNGGDAGLPEEEKGINWLLWGGVVVVVGALFVL